MLNSTKLSIAVVAFAATIASPGLVTRADEARFGGTAGRLERVSSVERSDIRYIEAAPLVYRSSSGAEATRRQLSPEVSKYPVLASSDSLRGNKPNPPVVTTRRVHYNPSANTSARSSTTNATLANYEQLQVVDSRPIDAASPAPLPLNERYEGIDAVSPRNESVRTYSNNRASEASYRVGVGYSDYGRSSRTSVGFSYSSGYSRYYRSGYYGYPAYGYGYAPVYYPAYCPPPVVYYRPYYGGYCGPRYYRPAYCGPRSGFYFSFRGRF